MRGTHGGDFFPLCNWIHAEVINHSDFCAVQLNGDWLPYFVFVLKVPPCLNHCESFPSREECALFSPCLLLYLRAMLRSARLAPNAVFWYPSQVAGKSMVEPGQSSDWEDFIHGILCSRMLCAMFQLQHLKVCFLIALACPCWLQLWHSSLSTPLPTVTSQVAAFVVFWPPF